MRTPFNTLAAKLGEAMQRLRRNERGVAAVEFALIVPIMFTLFVCTVETSQLLTVDRRVTLAASSTADLIARAPSTGLTSADVDANLLIIQQLMVPYASAPLTVKIVSVIAKTQNGATTFVVDWSRDTSGGTPYAKGTTYSNIPNGLLAAGESVIVSETTYNYVPLIFSYFINQGGVTLTETFYMKPRNAVCVMLNSASCVT